MMVIVMVLKMVFKLRGEELLLSFIKLLLDIKKLGTHYDNVKIYMT